MVAAASADAPSFRHESENLRVPEIPATKYRRAERK
jgi:hypothetical protein